MLVGSDETSFFFCLGLKWSDRVSMSLFSFTAAIWDSDWSYDCSILLLDVLRCSTCS